MQLLWDAAQYKVETLLMFVLDFTRENKWLFVCLVFGARRKCAMGLKHLFQSHQLSVAAGNRLVSIYPKF